MGLNPLRWKTKNLTFGVIITLVVYYLLLHKRSYEFKYNDRIENSKAEHVWEFVADFSNMLKLNTIITKFKIIDESGNYDDWKYSVEYTEYLRHFPSIENTALAHYSVKKVKHGFVISSTHRTCFLSGLYCLNTTSDFTFTQSGKDTICAEVIHYECPLLGSYLCQKEILEQRQDIMTNLKRLITKAK